MSALLEQLQRATTRDEVEAMLNPPRYVFEPKALQEFQSEGAPERIEVYVVGNIQIDLWFKGGRSYSVLAQRVVSEWDRLRNEKRKR
jgi:hypothetical protein